MPTEFRADLHCHSTCSDGTDTPQELLHKAKSAGLSALSITDHDTLAAYTPELFSLAKTLSLQLLTGVEISSELDKTNIHILGYNVDTASSSLSLFLREIHQRRTERNRKILANLARHNMPIEETELLKLNPQRTIGRPHIAALMVQKGYVRSLPDAFERYLKDGAPCYVPGFKFTPADAIAAIHAARGRAVLAHPHFIKKNTLLRQLLALPFDGIECYYGTLVPELEAPWIKIAQEKKWIATGGSDYHGTFKPQIQLGASWVDEITFQKLDEKFY